MTQYIAKAENLPGLRPDIAVLRTALYGFGFDLYEATHPVVVGKDGHLSYEEGGDLVRDLNVWVLRVKDRLVNSTAWAARAAVKDALAAQGSTLRSFKLPMIHGEV